MPKPFYNGTQADLASGAQNVVEIVTPVPATYGLTAGQVTAYTALTTDYVDKLNLAIEPATNSKVAIADKNAAKKLLRTASVDLARIITSTPTVTNAQLLSLRMNERVVPQPQPIPMTPPMVDIVSVVGRIAKIRAHDADSETNRGKPVGAVGVNVFTFIGPAAPTDPTEYQFQGMSTKCVAEISFPNTVPSGATVWVSCCWVGTRGNIGNGSVPVSFTLQGGAISAAA